MTAQEKVKEILNKSWKGSQIGVDRLDSNVVLDLFTEAFQSYESRIEKLRAALEHYKNFFVQRKLDIGGVAREAIKEDSEQE